MPTGIEMLWLQIGWGGGGATRLTVQQNMIAEVLET